MAWVRTYAGGIREPMFIVWPGRTKPNQHVDGVSRVPLLGGRGRLKRDAIYWHYPHYGNQGGAPGGIVREGDWKLIEWYEDGSLELFNLKTDIGEKSNLAKQHPKKPKWK